MEYFTLLIFTSFLVFLSYFKTFDIYKNIFFYIILLIIATLIGLRGMEDEYSQFYFLSEQNYNYQIHKEIGFFFIVKLLRILELGPQFIFILFGGLVFILHGLFFKKVSEGYFLALFFFICHDLIGKELTNLRFGTVCVLFLWGLYFLSLDKKKIAWFVSVIASTSIHFISIVTALGFFFRVRLSYNLVFFLIFLSYLLSLLISPELLISILSIFSDDNVIVNYLGDFHSASRGLDLRIIQMLFILTIYIFLNKFYKQQNQEISIFENIIFNSLVLSIIFQVLFINVGIFSFRIGSMFASVEPLLLAISIYRTKKLLYLILGLCYGLFIGYYNYIYLERVEPYIFF